MFKVIIRLLSFFSKEINEVRRQPRLIGRGPRFKQARARLYAKFPQYPREAAISSSDSVVVEVTPTHVFTWGLD